MAHTHTSLIAQPSRATPDSPIVRFAISPRLIGAVAWIVLSIVGVLILLNYSRTAGRSAPAPASWPELTKLAHRSGRWSLFLFCHPHCPCSRATLSELDRLMPVLGKNVDVRVCFYKPDDEGDGWVHQDLWAIASAIPDVDLFIDEGGHEAHRFGALTSGNAVLYDPNANLRFHGGITPARGHEGPNLGADAIRKFVAGEPCDIEWTETFGCSLVE